MSEPNGTPQTTQDPPIPWPHVMIDGVDIEIKFSMGLVYRASRAGISFGDLADRARSFGAIVDLISIIGNPVREQLGKPALSGEQWAERIIGFDQLTEISKAFNEAYVLSEKLKPAVSAPIPQTTAPEPRPN